MKRITMLCLAMAFTLNLSAHTTDCDHTELQETRTISTMVVGSESLTTSSNTSEMFDIPPGTAHGMSCDFTATEIAPQSTQVGHSHG